MLLRTVDANFKHRGNPPTGQRMVAPDLIDFYVTKGISTNYFDNIDELSSDYVPIMMILSSTIIRKKKKATITNRHTD